MPYRAFSPGDWTLQKAVFENATTHATAFLSAEIQDQSFREQNAGLLLAGVEIGLGSLLHALHLPFTGQVLSLHQIFLMALASGKGGTPLSATRISVSAALMKMGLGYGKRLTPFLAIAMQGLLFSGGFALGSIYLGAVLASLWAFAQPLLLAYVITAGDLPDILAFYVEKSAAWGIPVVPLFCAAVLLKAFLAWRACFAARSLGPAAQERYLQLLSRLPGLGRARANAPLIPVRPFALVSLLVLLGYYWWAHNDDFLLLSLRTLGLALLGSLLGRWVLGLLQKRSFS